MKPVYLRPALIPEFLRQEALRLRNPTVVTVNSARLRQWVHREKVRRTEAGYDLLSLGEHLERTFGRVA